MKILPIHIHFFEEDRKYILQEIEKKLLVGTVSQGEHVIGFEQAFANYAQTRHAIALSSGSAAIEIIMRLKNVAGKTVLVPANTNFATAVGPLRAGANVELVDIDPLTFSPSIADLEDAWKPDTVGLIIVHMGGIISPAIIQIRDWCKQKGIWLFEDCAHAHGSLFQGIHSGRFGFAGAFSFFATKVITSGEGGMLITDDDNLAQDIRLHRNLGKPELWQNYHLLLGTNARMGEFNALLGRVQLNHLDEFINWREKVANQYTELLKNCPDLRPILPEDRNSWYKYIVMLPHHVKREELKLVLKQNGVSLAGEIYELPLHRQPALANIFSGKSYPKAEDICAQHVCLPIYYGMTPEEVEFVIQSLLGAIDGASK